MGKIMIFDGKQNADLKNKSCTSLKSQPYLHNRSVDGTSNFNSDRHKN